jgi:hypothetical protein
LPESYWPKLAAAVLELESPPTAPGDRPAKTPAAEALAEWVRRRPSMTRWFYLSHLERLASRTDAAAAAMNQAAMLPIEVAADDPNVGAYYLWDMMRWAMETKRWPLATRLADSWELAHRERQTANVSYLPLRAAVRLAEGNLLGARKDLEAFDALPLPRRVWAQHIDTPGGLREAVMREDRGYRYSPGKLPGSFEVFPRPQ